MATANIIHLDYTAPCAFAQTLAFMRRRAISGVEEVTNNNYCRTFSSDGDQGIISVVDRRELSALELTITGELSTQQQKAIGLRVRNMFDLDTDFKPINALFAKDPLLARGMINGHVPRLPTAFDPFEFVVRAILGQQISVKAATTLAARIAKKAANTTANNYPGELNVYFPTAEQLLALQLDGLRITRRRQTTLKTVAQSIVDQQLTLTIDQPFEQFRQTFLALKGIGEWTVTYVAMRGLGMIDSFPANDLGVIKALEDQGKRPSLKQITARAEQWRPYRSYATLCLWNSMTTSD